MSRGMTMMDRISTVDHSPSACRNFCVPDLLFEGMAELRVGSPILAAAAAHHLCYHIMSSCPGTSSELAKLDEVLKRKRPIPSIKSPSSSEQLLKYALEVQEILRAEYTEKQCLAMEALERCIQLIQDERRIQLSDLDKCKMEKERLILNVHQSQTKLDAIQSRQNDLSQRIESLLSSCKSFQPQLSADEVRMRSDLEGVQQKCVHYAQSLKELTARHQFQINAMSGNDLSHDVVELEGDAYLSTDDQQQLEQILRRQNSSALRLIERINHLKQLIVD